MSDDMNPLEAARRWQAWSEKYAQPGDGPHQVTADELEALQPLVDEHAEIAAEDPFAANNWPRLVRNIELNDKRPYHFDADEVDPSDGAEATSQ